VELIFLNISSKVLTLSLGLEPDMFTLQANSPTTVLLTVKNSLLISKDILVNQFIYEQDDIIFIDIISIKMAKTVAVEISFVLNRKSFFQL
jgi:3-dehydroquinate dehydratase